MASKESAPEAIRGVQSTPAGVQWHELKSDADLAAAVQEAVQRNEPLVLEIGATWCAGCKIQDRALAQDKEFNGLAGQAVFARLEEDKYKLHEPAFVKSFKGYMPNGYPETFVIDSQNQQVITAFDGFPGAHIYTQSLQDAFHGKVPPIQQYAQAFAKYEDASGQKRDDAAAIDAMTTALNIATTNFGPTSEQAYSATFNLGCTYDGDVGDALQAESFFLGAAKIAEANPAQISTFDHDLSLYRLQKIYEGDGRFSDAIAMLQQRARLAPDNASAFQQQIDKLNAQAAQPEYQQYFSAVYASETADTKHDYASEIVSRNAALKIATANFGATSREAFDSTINLGLSYQKSGDSQKAEQAFLAASKIADAAPNVYKDEDRYGVLNDRLVYLYERTGDYAKAIAILQKEQTGGDSSTATALQQWIDRLKGEQK